MSCVWLDDFNGTIADMFQDQKDILTDSNIVMSLGQDINTEFSYLWYEGRGLIKFYRTAESVNKDGQKIKLIPIIHIIGLPDSGWVFDHNTLRLRLGSGPVKVFHDRNCK